jgi:outer membrane protein TolC
MMMLAILAGSLAASGVRAGESASIQGLTLDRIERDVRENNPAVRGARERVREARAMATAAAAWPAPGLGVTYADFPRPGLELSGADRKSLDLTQEVPFPGKTWLAARTARREAQAAEAGYRVIVEERLFVVRQAYWDLVVATATSRYIGQVMEALEKLVAISGRRNQFGSVGRMEQLMDPMARMELAQMKSQDLAVGQERISALAMLNVLMGADPDRDPGEATEPGVADTSAFADPGWIAGALKDGPGVRAAYRDLESLRAKRDQARAGWLPDFMVGYSAGEMADGKRTGMAMVRISLPFVWFWRPWNENRAATAGVSASEAELEGTRLAVRQMATVEISRLNVLGARLALVKDEILPQADRALKLAVSGYESGAVGPADALTAIRSYLAMNIERVMLEADIGRSIAVLLRLKGDSDGREEK